MNGLLTHAMKRELNPKASFGYEHSVLIYADVKFFTLHISVS